MERPLSFIQLASVSNTRHLSASLSAQDNSVLSFCDSPEAVSNITSAAFMPTLSRSIYHVKDGPATVNPQSTAHHQKLREDSAQI